MSAYDPTDSQPGTGGQARSVATGALLQQAAQASGLLVLLAIVTVLARRLSLAELGTYGLTATLATYLLIVKNSIGGAAQRAMVAAGDDAEREATFTTAAALYALAGLVTGVLIAGVGVSLSSALLDGELRHQAQLGVLGLGLVTAVGLAASVNLDAMRAALLLSRSAANEIGGLALFAVLMLGLAFSGAPLWALIAGSGAIPLLSGTINLVARRSLALPFRWRRDAYSPQRARALMPTAGWLVLIEASTLVIYGLDRVVLGAFGSAADIGLYEGPVRVHNVIYALVQALGVAILPVAAAYVAAGDRERLRRLVVEGSRYSAALFVPLAVTAMCLAAPALGVWLGPEFRGGETALTILVAYWLVYGAAALIPNVLVGAGEARAVGRTIAGVAALNLVLSVALTPSLGVEGPALGTTVAYAVGLPFMVRIVRRAACVSVADLLRAAWLPAYVLAVPLAASLVAVRIVLDPHSAAVVVPLLLAGPLLYWAAYAAVVLDARERALVRSLVSRRR